MIIPKRFSADLYEQVLASSKEYVVIAGAGHNDLWAYSYFIEELERVLSTLPE
jgi:fermentation-respiration switch protein FrsA (DUF1100 family)